MRKYQASEAAPRVGGPSSNTDPANRPRFEALVAELLASVSGGDPPPPYVSHNKCRTHDDCED